jgi:hypothetical protein
MPRSLISRESTSITRPERIEPATSMARHSRVYLKAFLIRKLIEEGSRYRLTDTQRRKHQRWLHEFESTQGASSDDFYNPYFGGGNPLHLGLCSGLGGGDDRLFYA